jgi:hypothetical protein
MRHLSPPSWEQPVSLLTEKATRFASRFGACFGTAIAGCIGAAGWSVAHAIGRSLLTVLAVSVVAVPVLAIVTIGAAVLDGRDLRSPFERLMLIACVMLGRPPGTYLPSSPDTKKRQREIINYQGKTVMRRQPANGKHARVPRRCDDHDSASSD